MPFVLVVIGAVFLVAAVRNSQQQLFFLLASDFTGPHNFIFWFISILIIGAIGYIPKMKPISDGFLILVILVLFLKKGTGVFDMFNKQIGTTETATPKVSTGQTATPGGVTAVNFTGGGNGGLIIGGGGISIGLGGGGGGPFGGGPLGCDPFWDPTCIQGYPGKYYGIGEIPGSFAL